MRYGYELPVEATRPVDLKVSDGHHYTWVTCSNHPVARVSREVVLCPETWLYDYEVLCYQKFHGLTSHHDTYEEALEVAMAYGREVQGRG